MMANWYENEMLFWIKQILQTLNFRGNVFCNFSHGVKEFQYTFELNIDVIDFVLYYIQFVAK